MKKLSLEQIAIWSMALALLILGGVGLLSYLSIDRFINAYRSSEQEAAVLIPLQQISAAVQKQVAEQRGYLLTDDERFLLRRQQAVESLRENMARLRQAAVPEMAPRVNELAALVASREALLEEVMQAQRAQGPEVAHRLLTESLGNETIQALEQTLAEMVRERQRALSETAAVTGQRIAPLVRNFFTSLALVTLVLAGLITLMLREMRRRQQALDAVARSEGRLQSVVDTAVDAIIVIDERGHVEEFNRAAVRIFGYQPEEVIGRNVSMLMPSPYREEHDGYMERYRRTGEKRIIGIGREVQAQRKDGSVFPIDLSVAEFRVGSKRRYSGIVRDISERKQAEERQAQLVREVEAANEELRNFAYITSHDLKAPLRAIGSLADWISVDYADKFDDEGKEQMRLLIGRVRRMDQLIDGILQYSRVGRVKEERVPVQLNALLIEVIDLLAPPANMQVEVRVLPTVVVERTRIQQVFQNLLSNAIRYMDKPQGRIQVGAEPAAGEWRFHVRDNGPGIEARHRERIFLLFQTLQPRDRTESTGVGLSLVKKIVEMYGGRVWVESEPGQGSTFYFTLPESVVRSEERR